MNQQEYANELLRAALDIFEASHRSFYVKSLGEFETKANGGGDGTCVMEELRCYFDQYNVKRDPQCVQEEAA